MEYLDFVAHSGLGNQDYHCRFVYLQTAISLRHSDTIDVKFLVNGTGVVVALPHTAWEEYKRQKGRGLRDEEAAQVAATLLREALECSDNVGLLELNPTAQRVVELASQLS